MARLIVLDLGGVVFPVDMGRVGERLGQLYPNQVVPDNLLGGALKSDWDAFEEGRLACDAFFAVFEKVLGFEVGFVEFVEAWTSIYDDSYEEVESLIEELTQYGQVVALTNTNALHGPVWRARYRGVCALFHTVYSSHEIGVRKPEADAFNHILQQMGISAEHSFFVDDNPDNVAAAQSLGMNGFCADPVHGLASVFGQLRKCLESQ